MEQIKPKIILFNGPPFSGKDTVANELCSRIGPKATVVKFAQPLKTVAKHLYCNGDQALFDRMDSPAMKNLPDDLFFGKSCREVQIGISEIFAKPFHGTRVFGQVLASTIRFKADEGKSVFLISDSGFRPEAEQLINEFGAENILLVRIHRPGKSFEGDSRSYIDLTDVGVRTVDLNNNDGEFKKTMHDVINIVQPLILKD